MSEINVESLTLKLDSYEASLIAYAIRDSLISSIDSHYVRFPDEPKLLYEQNSKIINLMDKLETISSIDCQNTLKKQIDSHLSKILGLNGDK